MNDDDEYLPTIHEDGTIKVTKKQKIQKNEEEESNKTPIIPKKPLTKSERKKEKRKEKKEQAKREKEMQEQQAEDEEILKQEEEEKVELTPEQLARKKEKHFNEAMTEIAVKCEKIIENPHKGVTRHRNEISDLNAVIRYLQDDDVRVRILAILSLMKVFNDILPVFCFASPSS